MSYLRIITLRDLFDTAYLYDIRLGGTKVLSVDFNKMFLLIFVSTFGTIPHRNSMHPWLLPSILLSIVTLSLCPGALELQSPLLWLTFPCVQQYLSKYVGIGWGGCPWQGPVEGVGGMLVFFLTLFPSLAEISCISSSFWARTCCRRSAMPEIGGLGSSGGLLFTVFAWFSNSAKRRIAISSTKFACPYPASSKGRFYGLGDFSMGPLENESWMRNTFSWSEGGNSRTWWTLKNFWSC